MYHEGVVKAYLILKKPQPPRASSLEAHLHAEANPVCGVSSVDENVEQLMTCAWFNGSTGPNRTRSKSDVCVAVVDVDDDVN